VAWTSMTPAGSRSFTTSLGHPEDFKVPAFRKLLHNGLRWAARLDRE
jgi:type 1 glutamine amidotransferase